MTGRKSIEQVFHFDEEGTLARPGPIGRGIRLALGALLVKFVYDWLTLIHKSDYGNPLIWLYIALSAVLAPYVVNIGFGVNFGAWPRYALLGIWALATGAGYVAEGVVASGTLWWVIEATQIYVYGHLGISFVLAAILATPGCEMRGIPHLLGKVTRAGAREHYCPGFIDNIDRWERKLWRKSGADE